MVLRFHLYKRDPQSKLGRFFIRFGKTPAGAHDLIATPHTRNGRTEGLVGPRQEPQNGDRMMKVLVRTPEGVEEVREVDSDDVIPGDILDDGSFVLELWDELSDDDYLALGLYD